MQLDNPLAAELVPCIGAAAAKVVSERPGLVADIPWLFLSVQLGSLTHGHPEESVSTELGSVGRGMRTQWVLVVWCVACRCYSPLGALGCCARLVCRVSRLVMYDPVVVRTFVARVVLCCFCVQLDAML